MDFLIIFFVLATKNTGATTKTTTKKSIPSSTKTQPKAFVVFYFCNYFCSSIHHPKIRKTSPPYTPPRLRILSIIPPIAAANYPLIVAS
jgi:hypothetical protein